MTSGVLAEILDKQLRGIKFTQTKKKKKGSSAKVFAKVSNFFLCFNLCFNTVYVPLSLLGCQPDAGTLGKHGKH